MTPNFLAGFSLFSKLIFFTVLKKFTASRDFPVFLFYFPFSFVELYDVVCTRRSLTEDIRLLKAK